MSRNIRILLVAVVAFAAVGGYWKLALAPKRAEAADLAQQVSQQKAQLATSQGLLATYSGAKDAYKANYATVVRLGKAVPSDDDTRSLVVQLDAAAKRSNTAFDNIDVTAAGGAGNQTAATAADTSVAPGAISTGAYSVMPFSLAFNGDFSTLESFLGRLQRFVTVKGGGKILVNGRLMRVESINLQPGDKGWPALNAVVTASSYIVPDATAPAGAPSTSPSTTTTTTSAAAADKPGSLNR